MAVANPVERATLETLIERVPGTAAEGVPLVLNLDVVQGSWPNRMRHDNFNSLYVAERGRGVHVIDTKPYGISRGDVYVMSSGSDHTFTNGDRLVLHAIHFAPEIFDKTTWWELSDLPGFELLLAGRERVAGYI